MLLWLFIAELIVGSPGACGAPPRVAAPPPAMVEMRLEARASGTVTACRETLERYAWVMGTGLRIVVEVSGSGMAVGSSEAALATVEGLESRISSWRPDSEIGRVSVATPGASVEVSSLTARLLREAFAWRRETEGAFDPAVGSLVNAWDLRGSGRIPSPDDLAAALEAAGPEAITVDPRRPRVVRRHRAAWLDAGGFGKGAALRMATRALRERGVRRALLDFGGQLQVLGDACDGRPGWPIALAHPAVRDSTLLEGRLLRGSLATSGASERTRDIRGKRVGHILDPRSGLPVDAWGSVTVAADDPLTADVVATAVFVLGPEEGLEWMNGRDDAGAVFLIDEGDRVLVRRGGNLDKWLRLETSAASMTSGRSP